MGALFTIVVILVVAILYLKDSVEYTIAEDKNRSWSIRNGCDFYINRQGKMVDLPSDKVYYTRKINGEEWRIDAKTHRPIRKIVKKTELSYAQQLLNDIIEKDKELSKRRHEEYEKMQNEKRGL